MVVDCQTLSDLVISSNTVNSGIVAIDNGFGTETVYINDFSSPVSLFCSGTADVTLSNGLSMAITNMSGAVFSDNLLMGLAGIVCGALICYVFVKYAI